MSQSALNRLNPLELLLHRKSEVGPESGTNAGSSAPGFPVWPGLLASIALHLLIVFFWRPAPGEREMPAAKTPALLVQLMTLQAQQHVPPEPEATKATPASPAPLQQLRTKMPTAASEAPSMMPAPSAAPAPDEKNDLPALNVPVESTILNAKRDIGKIDRDLRKNFPKLPEAAPTSIQSQLEKGIAAAAKPRATTMEEITSPDGRRMTKVTGPGGTYCVRKEGVGATDGLDMIQGGVRAKTTNCPEQYSF